MALTKVTRGVLSTGIDDQSDATAITITSAENVGIGTSSPNAYSNVTTLTVNGSTQGRLDLEYGGTHGGSFLALSGETQIKAVGASNDMTFEVNNAERMRINTAGRVFIGSTSAVGTEDFSYLGPAGSDTTLQVMCPDNTPGREIQLRLTNNNATFYPYGAAFRAVQGGGINSYTLYVETNATGGVYLSGGGTSWSSVSDERHKTIIEDIDNASEKVSTLRTVIGSFNDDPDSKRRPFLIAQDVQAVLPEAVDDTANPDKLGLSYTDVIPLLTAAIKEQKAIIDDLKTRIETLENA